MPIFDDWNANTTLDEAVFQAIGAASACWEDLDKAGIFESDKAKAIGEELIVFLKSRAWLFMEKDQDVEVATNSREPYLGLATTEQLFRELIARMTIPAEYINSGPRFQQALILAEMLGGLTGTEKEYRTVDSY